MNKIYKVIWSKVKHQYVVVSELAHSCTKSTSSRVGRSAAAVLAALVLTTGVCAVPVQAEDLTDPYALLNEKVEKSKNSDPIVELVQSPLAKAASETTAETNSDNQPADEEATTPTQPADSPKQHTIINQDGIYASNGKGTYNTLSKDGLWVGGTDDNTGFHVDNDGNVRTTERITATSEQGDVIIQNGQVSAHNNNGTASLSGDGLVISSDKGSAYLGDGNLILTGDIQADSGTIGEVEMENGNIQAGSGTIGGVDMANDNIQAGSGTIGGVDMANDNIQAGSGTIGGVDMANDNIQAGSGTIGGVDMANDNIQAGSGTIGGVDMANDNIQAGSGTIGGVDMANDNIQAGSGTIGGVDMANDNIQAGSGTIGGVDMANDNIQAGSGTIGGVDMANDNIQAGSGTIGGVNIANDNVTSLSNTTWSGKKEDVVSGRAATEDQLMTVQKDVDILEDKTQHITHTTTDNGHYTTIEEHTNFNSDGSIDAVDGQFRVTSDGGLKLKDEAGNETFRIYNGTGGMEAAKGQFKVNGETGEVSVGKKDENEYAFAVNKDGDISTSGTLSVSNGKFTVDTDGNTEVDGTMVIQGQTIINADADIKGSLEAAGNKFKVDGITGEVTAPKGNIGGVILETTDDGKSKVSADKADIDGVWIKEGSITTEEGTITAGDVVINSAGSEKINVGNGNFIVYEDGAVRAADDNFIVHKDGSVEAQGTVQAADATNFEVGSRELVTAGQLAAAGIVPGTAFENGVAIGENAMATAAYTVAVGEGSQAFGNSSTALGYDTHVDASAKNAVALGANSVADRADTVSVGSKDNERQITNVAAGTASTDAVNVKQLTDRTANMVEWDEGTDDTIHGVTLENGMITAADGKFKVYGTGGIYAADGKFQVNGNTGDVSADGNLKAADGKFFVNGESGSVTAADGDFKVSSKGDVTAAGSLTAADEKFKVYGASGGFMAADGKVEVNGYTGDIRTDGKVTANEIHAANDNFIVYESGVVKLNGGNLVIGTNGDLNSKGTITGNVLSTGGFVANADGNAEAKGTVTANTLSTGADGFIANSDGDFEARNAHIDGTLLVGEKFKVTPDGELIAANSAFKVGADGTVTAVRGGSIGGVELKDGEVTGLNNTMWDAGDIVNDRAATEGQLAVVDAQVNANSDELTKYKNAGIVAGGASEIGNGIALGAGSSANAGSIAVGDMAWVMGKDSVGLGNDISVGGSDAVAIGNNINLVANNSVALGNGSAAARENTVSVGSSGNERQITNVAAGTEGTDAVNVNQLNEVKSSVTSVGDDLAAYKAAGIVPGVAVPEDVEGAMALGEGSEAVNVNAVAVGPSAKASGSFSLAFGAGATTDGANAMALGRGSNSSADNAIALGKGTEALAKNAIAIGAEASAVANNSVALGVNSKATESNVISVGDVGSERKIVNVADGKNEHDAVNFGQLKEVRDVTDKLTGAGVVGGYVGETTTSMAAGVQSSATGENSVALGPNAVARGQNSVALGAGSKANRYDSVSVGDSQTGLYRQITNVAAGTADTDAVNVSQIKGMVRWDQAADDSYLEGTLRGVTLSEGTITAADGKFVVNNDPASDSDAILTIGGDNVFRINENGSIVASSGAFRVFSEGGFSAANGKFKVHAADGSVTTPLVTGLTNKNWDATHDYSESTLAATEAQLQAVAEEAGKHTQVTVNGGNTDGNLKVTSAVNNGQTTYDISLSDTITMRDDTKGVTMDSSTIVFKNQLDDGMSGTRNAETNIAAGSLSIKGSDSNEDRTYIDGASIMVGSAESGAAQTHITAKEITIGGDLTQIGATALRITNNGVNDRTITGLTNMSWKNEKEWLKDNVDPSRAATEGQLAGIQEQVTANRTDINDLTTKFNEAGINTNSLEKAVAVANQLDGANLSALSALSQISPMNMAAPMNAAVPTRNPNVEGESGESGTTGDTSRVPVEGLTVTDDQISTDRDFSVGGNLSVSGDTTLGGKLTVDGEATFNDNVSIKGDLNMNNNKITGVAAGDVNATSTDAVNGSQLYGVQQDVEANAKNISTLGGAVNKLGNRIDEVGAGAAALAALHPLDFDPDNKWDFSAGYGNYRGESAVAFGAFYRPNEDTMFSVGGTVGNDDNMVNAGVSLKIGSGSSGVTTSRVAMAKEIKAMRDVVAKQDAQIQKLTAMVNALVGVQTEPDTTTMFPDVPENHWAYEAVAAMARSGLVKGYPDGEFKGDRTMTRYEFAQIIQNAIQAGAEVDSRLVEEFKPELEYFHIATVAKDKDGNPTIERVRAN
ncbi:ESPR-type extended signal peptide-containing protein [uncultured Megasphaera sp.]|nr:ESPR-type extended signal peptide-containing protein [uncultured Megasphaera sp.]